MGVAENEVGPEVLAAHEVTPWTLLESFRRGSVCVMPAHALLDPKLLRLTPDVLVTEQGDVRVTRVLSSFIRQYAEKHGVPRSQWPADCVPLIDDPTPRMRDLIRDVKAETTFKPDSGFAGGDAWNSGDGLLRAAYGITNVRKLHGMGSLVQPCFSLWSYVFNFVWIGWSSGGLHFDNMDNVLAQVCGTKEVVIFPPHVTPLIDGGHYPTKFESREFFSQRSLDASPHLGKVPYYRVLLTPGVAVSIPSGAYHAPLATSHDSISINSFLAPSLLRRSFGSFKTGQFLTAEGLRRYLGSWLGYYMKWFGWLPALLRFGNYEYY